jgi:hypothetical protein
MSQRVLILSLAVALTLAGLAGWALAQHRQAEQAEAARELAGLAAWAQAQQAPPGQKKADGAHGPFAVAASGETAVLLDTASGKTWVLRRAADGGAVWVPARRLDSEKGARAWLEEERAKGTALQDQERARRAALEDRGRVRAEEAEKEAQRLRMQEMLRRAQLDRERARTALEEAERRVRQLDQELKSPGR